MEHPAVEEVLSRHFERRRSVLVIRVAPDPATGVITPSRFRAALEQERGGESLCRRVALVTIMHANNETGVVQPIPELVKIARSMCGPTVVFHSDAAQTIGKIPVDVEAMGVDMLSICPHKFYGPKGVGALYHRPGTIVPHPVTFGAGHESGKRPGTENIVLINGMAAAIEIAARDLEVNRAHMKACRDTLAQVLTETLQEESCQFLVNGSLEHALPNTLNIAVCNRNGVFISAQRLMNDVGLKVAMSAGSACHSTNGDEPVVVSSSLSSVGVGEERAVGTLRLTTGRLSTIDDMRRAAKIIGRKCVEQLHDL
jgi:cysteine sulfinate desulfinase/cysteine desulfurase-like protein